MATPPKSVISGQPEHAGKAKTFSSPMDVRFAFQQGIAQLREAHVPSFTLAAELLLLHVLERGRTWLYAHPEEPISEENARRFFALVARRAAGEPTQHLTGRQEFWGLELEVTPDVLIPRPETEHVVEVALDRLAVRELHAGRPRKTDGAGLSIADIGTGSGCIVIALAKELPRAAFFATDISAAALAVACRNAERHGVRDRIHFSEGNLLENILPRGAQHAAPNLGKRPRAKRHESPSFDLIVSNPPYIGRLDRGALMREVREHEPEIALYGGEQGHEFYGDLIAEAALRLKPGGILVLELGHNSLSAVQPLLGTSAWKNIRVTRDLAGILRVLSAEKI